MVELKLKASLFQTTGIIETLDGVFKSDTIIPDSLRLALEKAVRPLEDVPDRRKDWHPKSNEQVLDLVHPSLYPLVYGQTKILTTEKIGVTNCLEKCGLGETIPAPPRAPKPEVRRWPVPNDKCYSEKFQWLPADVVFDEQEANKVKFASYINNLHPVQYTQLYEVVEQVIEKAIPLWNRTLFRAQTQLPVRVRMKDNGYEEGAEEEPSPGDGEDYNDFETRWDEWNLSRVVREPEPGLFATAGDLQTLTGSDNALKVGEFEDFNGSIDLAEDFREGLQIIVKLANIVLTPEKPDYPGGTWHVEGQANENICASAIYYYASENIGNSRLTFRHAVDADDWGPDVPYEQGDHRAIQEIYGMENDEPAVQNLGSVVTRQGRLISFPNTKQHCVEPFSLEDKTRPGHRKILALFLVDPHAKIISTANVPPQQRDWWRAQIDTFGLSQSKLPQELKDHVAIFVDYPVSLETAKEQRAELMEERKNFVADDKYCEAPMSFSVSFQSSMLP